MTRRLADDGPAAHRHAVAQLLARCAARLDLLGLPEAGLVRHGARLLLEVPTVAEVGQGNGCAGCGTPITQPAKGGLRKWCTDACRSRTRRR